MNPTVNIVANRLSLRPPQRESLEILAKVCDLIPLDKSGDVAQALKSIKAEFPTVTDFERDFPSLCFALATGVGKTRLMGAFIAYLFKAEGIRHFFVLAPNLTIYDKLIADFTPNTPKYVFQGIAEFAVNPPEIITGDNYETGRGVRGQMLFGRENAHVNIFNISKITSTETPKGGTKSNIPRFRRLQEYIGQSYFEYLSKLDDLVLIMDESHRYRASAGMKAIGELKPILGLELTATPQTERGSGVESFRNVIYSYPLSNAMSDGFVKEPAVATRQNFDPKNYDPSGLERLKLEDGVRIHENTKVELEVYGRESDKPIVKPFMLVIARDTEHANALVKAIEDPSFFEGRYKGKVITVHSKLKGEEADETVEQLIHVERPDNPTEIVVHVNMLKEGWDVTNLYTIVPLRAANSQTLVEQSIGRGLRLPYGKRTGVGAVDRLTIVSHDKFQEIVDYANSPNSIIRGGLKVVYIGDERSKVVVAEPEIVNRIVQAADPRATQKPLFETPKEQEAAKAVLDVIHREYERLPRSADLARPEVQREIAERVKAIISPPQKELEGVAEKVDIPKVVAKTIALRNELSIDLPKITIQPVGNVTRGYREFQLDLAAVRVQPVDNEILIQELQSRQQQTLKRETGAVAEERLEDYLVRGLIDFNDISYDDHAELLYKLAGQVVAHLRSYLKNDDEVLNVLQFHQPVLVNLIHVQMQEHYEEKAISYVAHVSKGFVTLRPANYSAREGEGIRDFRVPVEDKHDIRNMIFGGFQRCIRVPVKFDSDPERRFAVLLENKKERVIKWFRPSKGDFQIHYTGDESYEPDFVVETETEKLLCEPKRASEMTDKVVLAKAQAAAEWCVYATQHELKNGGKPWSYLLIPDDIISENKTLEGLAASYRFKAKLAPAPAARPLPFQKVTPKKGEHYRTCVPLVDVRAAAGKWSAEQGPYDPGDWTEDWVTFPRRAPFEQGMFVAQVIGDSMVPEIPDGAHCLFRQPPAGTREGRRLLIWHSKIGADGQYTVKVYSSQKVQDRDGNWTHTKIVLKPLNKAHQPIELTIRDEGEVRVIGEFVEVVGT